MSKDQLVIKISKEQIRAGLEKVIRSEHSALISRTIIDNLTITDVGLSQLYQALSGVRPIFKFKVLDEVYIPYSNLSTWKMDDKRMKESELVFQDRVKALIVEFDPLRSRPYKLEYTFIKSDGEREKEDMWSGEQDLVKDKDFFSTETDVDEPF